MKYVVVDTETTGLSPRYNQVLTVGMLLVDVERDFLEILNSRHIFIKHDSYNVNAAALAVNKINLNEHHKTAVEPALACSAINSFVVENQLKKTPIIGHNIGFDKAFLRSLFVQGNHGMLLNEKSVDTMHLWRGLKKKEKVPLELRSNLGTIASYFDIDYTKAHDALADCHITAQVYHKMLGLL